MFGDDKFKPLDEQNHHCAWPTKISEATRRPTARRMRFPGPSNSRKPINYAYQHYILRRWRKEEVSFSSECF